MNTVLREYQLRTVPVGRLEVEIEGKTEHWPTPRQFVLNGELCLRNGGNVRVNVEVLLDTGNDITLLSKEARSQLEFQLGAMIPVERRIRSQGVMCPAFDVAFVLPDTNHECSSQYGFIEVDTNHLDVGDLWLGQDLFNQWVMTLDGLNGTLTIVLPE